MKLNRVLTSVLLGLGAIATMFGSLPSQAAGMRTHDNTAMTEERAEPMVIWESDWKTDDFGDGPAYQVTVWTTADSRYDVCCAFGSYDDPFVVETFTSRKHALLFAQVY